MCGICGIVYSDPSRKVLAKDLAVMNATLCHRGPDDEGVRIDRNVGLGNRRLAIIDLDTGHMPISNEDGTIWITYNGQVYNFRKLRADLEARGHVFRTRTDTEVIVHLYEEMGFRAVESLEGMFAFAIWDSRKKVLFCARDRFGIKPLHYSVDPGRFVFASEMKAIRAVQAANMDIDEGALDSYFAYGYVTGSRTIFKQIRKLPPAHYLIVTPNNAHEPEFRRYWDFAFEPEHGKKDGEWEEELEACLADAVRDRLMSDVPLGAFLSGGMDSSTVVAMMSRFSDKPVKTFSIGFEDREYDELPFARQVARDFGTEHHEVVLKPESVDLLPVLVDAYDEPFADPSAIPTYHVSRLAGQHVTVALSGDGGDEMLAGYDDYGKWRTLSLINRTSKSKVGRFAWKGVHASCRTGYAARG